MTLDDANDLLNVLRGMGVTCYRRAATGQRNDWDIVLQTAGDDRALIAAGSRIDLTDDQLNDIYEGRNEAYEASQASLDQRRWSKTGVTVREQETVLQRHSRLPLLPWEQVGQRLGVTTERARVVHGRAMAKIIDDLNTSDNGDD